MAAKKKYDWDAIHGDFTRSNISLRDLDKKHGVKYSYLASKSSEQNWCEQRDTIQAQAREAVAQELAARTDEQNDALADITCKDGEAQVKRSLQTGDRLYTLFQAAVTAMTQGNIREMRQAIDAWVVLDNQMRKIHGVDDKADKPLVNINVLAALPSREEREMAKATVEVA